MRAPSLCDDPQGGAAPSRPTPPASTLIPASSPTREKGGRGVSTARRKERMNADCVPGGGLIGAWSSAGPQREDDCP